MTTEISQINRRLVLFQGSRLTKIVCRTSVTEPIRSGTRGDHRAAV